LILKNIEPTLHKLFDLFFVVIAYLFEDLL
jgi:hypothetical protein